nr:hypothetical protein [Tanacetum cinerariifolium]
MSVLAITIQSTAMVAAGVVTGEGMGDGTVRDAGETGKEPEDHSGDSGEVESDGDVILVLDASMGSDSSSECRVSWVQSRKAGV